MTTLPASDILRRLGFFHGTGADKTGPLYSSALEKLDLSQADYITIRDLVELSGHDDPAVHALLLCMFDRLCQGAVCLNLERAGLENSLSRFAPGAADLAERIVRDISSFDGLVQTVPAGSNEARAEEFLPLVYVIDSGRVYFQKYYLYERKVAGELERLMKRGNVQKAGADNIRRMMKSVLEENPLCFRGSPAVLNPAQIMALCLSLTGGFTVISGGPGTGKTSIVLNILRLFSRAGVEHSRMMVAAPTGRAAQRLTESVRAGLSGLSRRDSADMALDEIEAVTVHRLLKYSPSKNGFFYGRGNRLPADILIVDEVSMIDIVLLGKLLEAADDGASIVLLGDRNQLPSVEAGAVFADLLPGENVVRYSVEALSLLEEISPLSDRAPFKKAGAGEAALSDHFVILDESYRSEKSILEAAVRINRQDPSAADFIQQCGHGSLPLEGIYRVDPGPEGKGRRVRFESLLENWADVNYGRRGADDSYAGLAGRAGSFAPDGFQSDEFVEVMRGLFGFIEGSRILSPVRRGDFGTEGINARMSSIMAQVSGRAAPGSLLCGPVIVLQNDYARELFNGDVGVTIRAADGESYVFFRGSAGFRFFPLRTVPAHEPAWAVTVHKSQGSEYDRVLLALDERAGRMLTREIVYTAITRARSLALIYGDRDSVRKAVASATMRESGIDLAAIL